MTEPQQHQGRSFLLWKNPGVRGKVARELLLHPTGSDLLAFGSGSGQAFVLEPFQKREFLWQLGSSWSPAVGTPWVPPQRMA